MGRTATFDSKVIAEYAKTHTVEETRLHFKCSHTTVMQACQVHEVEPVTQAVQRRQEHADWVRKNNATLTEACKHFGVTSQRIVHACQVHGVELKPEPRDKLTPVSYTNFEILAFLLAGYTQTQVAEEMCVSRQRIQQIRQRAEQARLIGPSAFVEVKPTAETEERSGQTVVVLT